jgi:probable regulatory domain-containing protein
MSDSRDRVLDLFLAAVDASGGLGRMVRERRLMWLPDLMQAAYIVLQQEDEHRSLEEIADDLGVPRDLVENVLSGPVEQAQEHLEAAPPQEPFELSHLAGGMARRAYGASAPAKQ